MSSRQVARRDVASSRGAIYSSSNVSYRDLPRSQSDEIEWSTVTLSVDISRASNASLRAMSAPVTRAWIAALVIVGLLGAVVGATAGYLLVRSQSVDVTASSIIRISPPVDLAAIVGGASSPQPQSSPDSYVAGEVAYLSGEGFARAVSASLGQPEPAKFTITRSAASSVITVVASAANSDEAVKIVKAAVDLYTQQLRQRVDAQLLNVLPALDQWEAAANQVQNNARVDYVRALRDSVVLQASQSNVIEVLQPPTVNDSTGAPWAIPVLFGGLLGALIAVLGLSAYHNRSGRLRSPTDMADEVDGFIVPAVDLGRRAVGKSARSAGPGTIARTLYAQCPGVAPARIIVLIGASKDSGTAAVAALLERAAAETGPVARVTLTDPSVDGLPVPTAGETTLIVDASGLGESGLTTEAISAATDLILVARLNVDTVPQSLAVRSATASSPVPLLAVVTYRRWWSRAAKTRTHSARSGKTQPANRHDAQLLAQR